jgi:hypothetical protein
MLCCNEFADEEYVFSYIAFSTLGPRNTIANARRVKMRVNLACVRC